MQADPAASVIVDRSVWSDWVFARQARHDGFLSADQFAWYLRLRQRIGERLPVSDLAIVHLDVAPSECLHRVHHVRRRPFESGISLAYLDGLDRFYNEFLADMHGQRGVPVLRFDWNRYGDVEQVVAALKSAL